MDKKLMKLKKQLIKYAKEIAKGYNYKLDYSEKSIEIIESILSDIHINYKKHNHNEGLEGIALEFGFYIIAVIEKNYGKGELEANSELVGDGTFPFTIKGLTLFPVEWCRKRIYYGDDDNVQMKYKIFTSKLK